MAMPSPNLQAAQGALWLSAICVAALGILWGTVAADYALSIRIIVAAVMPALAFGALVYGLTLISAKVDDESGLYADCALVTVPVKVPTDGHLFVLDLAKQSTATRLGGLALITTQPGTDYPFTGGTPIVQKCEITNYNSGALTNVEIELDVVFREMIPNPDGGNRSGKITLQRPWPIKIGKIDPGAANPFVFYAFNVGAELAQVRIPDTATAQRMGNSTLKTITITKSNNIFINLPPPFKETKKEEKNEPYAPLYSPLKRSGRKVFLPAMRNAPIFLGQAMARHIQALLNPASRQIMGEMHQETGH
jgi:hypothetical protein